MMHFESIIPRLDLRGVKSLSGVAVSLNEIVETIGADMDAEFQAVVGEEMDAVANVLPSTEAVRRDGVLPFEGSLAERWARNIMESRFSFLERLVASPVDIKLPSEFVIGNGGIKWMETGERLREALLPIVHGLLRMGRLGSALEVYKDALLVRVRHFSKMYYPEGGADTPASTKISSTQATYDYV
jgi:hypothetical protein